MVRLCSVALGRALNHPVLNRTWSSHPVIAGDTPPPTCLPFYYTQL